LKEEVEVEVLTGKTFFSYFIISDINWTWVDEETKERLGLKSKDDGEFWMSYKDFCRHFSEVTICLMGPDFDGDGVSDQAGMLIMMILSKIKE
jgi:hypothetical protein